MSQNWSLSQHGNKVSNRKLAFGSAVPSSPQPPQTPVRLTPKHDHQVAELPCAGQAKEGHHSGHHTFNLHLNPFYYIPIKYIYGVVIYLSVYLVCIYIYTRNAWVLPRRCSVEVSHSQTNDVANYRNSYGENNKGTRDY